LVTREPAKRTQQRFEECRKKLPRYYYQQSRYDHPTSFEIESVEAE
jgi:hypothetical protein